MKKARAHLAANMIRLRRIRGWTQETLSFESGLHRTFIAHVERQSRNISLDNIEKIATALGVSVGYLLSTQTGEPDIQAEATPEAPISKYKSSTCTLTACGFCTDGHDYSRMSCALSVADATSTLARREPGDAEALS